MLPSLITTLFRRAGAWPLADQAIVSLGSFLTNVSLARVLSVGEYGAFAFLLDLLFLLNSIHAALVTYALSVRGAGTDAATLRSLSGTALIGTILLSAPLVVAIAAAAVIVGVPHVSGWAATALLLWTVQETVRRALMTHLRHDVAIWGDAISYLGQATLVWTFRASLTLEGAFTIMALTSAAAAAVQAAQLGLRAANLRADIQGVWRLFAFGRWALLIAFTSVFTVQAFTWSIVFFHGTGALAGFQSIANLVRVSHPVMLSTANVLVPAVAAAMAGGGVAAARQVSIRYSVQGGVLLLPYFALLIVAPEYMLRLMYGPASPYLPYGNVLRVMAAGYVLLFIGEVAAAVLRGLQKSRETFIAEACRSVAVLGAGVPLTASFGVLGACWGGLAAVAARVAVLAVFIRAAMARQAETQSPDGAMVSRDGASPA